MNTRKFEAWKTYENHTAGARVSVARRRAHSLETDHGTLKVYSLNGCEFTRVNDKSQTAILADRLRDERWNW